MGEKTRFGIPNPVTVPVEAQQELEHRQEGSNEALPSRRLRSNRRRTCRGRVGGGEQSATHSEDRTDGPQVTNR